MPEELKLSGTKVPVTFCWENEEGQEESMVVEVDSQVFLVLSQDAMRKGIRVEEYILDVLLESLNG